MKLTTQTKLMEAAQTALDVQNACNLSGVVGEFQRILSEVLWPYATEHGKGTDWVNHHPISCAFSNKIASLTGEDDPEIAAFHALLDCEKIAEGNFQDDEG